eukprot:6489906-Amphidinium_carterae.1
MEAASASLCFRMSGTQASHVGFYSQEFLPIGGSVRAVDVRMRRSVLCVSCSGRRFLCVLTLPAVHEFMCFSLAALLLEAQ